ncbi:E3 ubiquitin-protein ligase RSL1 [Ziziphus jujuba]|uniref:RBR-type E3 ubiquitin transferase n=1 Tax=Ziziphus jujuba TaxID=326968 RepID=A0A6P4ABJ9_ZIZJJ|nr:E3 ubiquitin-protein ligase RSL1 [Ziziphus jujuba]XP_015885225.3 E3 ubiquitin-protein ligase RSL1 [Ziziphus jujuba]XP_048331717.2 E3 ubiquitin-protein ligase RSL1 [Ziziphus jujuba]
MEDEAVFGHGTSLNVVREEDEEEFRSCCEDEEVWKDNEEPLKGGETNDDLDEFSVKMFFKGISISGFGDSSSGLSGIGVFIERSSALSAIQVQKKLDFYVEEPVADYLALMDGLMEVAQNNIRRVYAFTDSELLYDQITNEKKLETPLLVALRQRILEHASNLEAFVLKFVPCADLERPLKLAKVAIGVVSFPEKGNTSFENCSICCEDKLSLMMITLKCSHKFCSHCMRTYVDGKLLSSQVPTRCPQLGCKYWISNTECKSFLTSTSYESLEKALAEANIFHCDRIYCPFPNCSVLLDPRECLSARASSSSQSDNSCIECPVCQRFICVDCVVPWHSSMSCEEYQSLPLEERDASDITLHRLAQNKKWRRCQQCRRMIELTQGCYHMTCWCGHEFCYSCGAEYREGQQTCQCAFWDEDNSEDLVTQSMQESEQWAWETFNSLPMVMDAYSDQERSQLALIQRFLAGGFSLSDHHPYQSPPRCTDSYVDAMKDLNQLPWLERFVSVISDNYYEDYIQ